MDIKDKIEKYLPGYKVEKEYYLKDCYYCLCPKNHLIVLKWGTAKRDKKEKEKFCYECYPVPRRVKYLPDYMQLCERKNYIYLGVDTDGNEVNFNNKIIPLPEDFFYCKCNDCDYVLKTKFKVINERKKCINCSSRRKKTLEDFYQLAETKGGKYLGYTKENIFYENSCPSAIYTLSKWECNIKHTWTASYSQIKYSTWCPICPKPNKKLYNDYVNLANKYSGKYLGYSKDGIFFEKEILNAENKNSTWECKNMHRFEKSYSSINCVNSFCKICNGYIKTLEDYKNLPFLKKINGEYLGFYNIKVLINNQLKNLCLSLELLNEDNLINPLKIPKNTHSINAIWKCYNCEYIFNKRFDSISENSFCTSCIGRKRNNLYDYRNLSRILDMNFEYIGIKKNNILISDELPKNSGKKSFWKCNDCNLEWETSYRNLLRYKKGCIYCNSDERTKNIIHYENLLTEKNINGKFLGVKNEKGEYNYEIPDCVDDCCYWECNFCNFVNYKKYIIIKRNPDNFCHQCTHGRKYQKLDLEDYELLSTKMKKEGYYIGIKINDILFKQIPENSHTKCFWYCNVCKSDFETTYNTIKGGSWCNLCFFKTQKKLYDFLIRSFPENKIINEFKSDLCINEITNRKLRFDFYFKYKEKDIIIELDGDQHFMQVLNWSDYKQTQENDFFKMKCMLDNGYRIIRILQPDVWENKINWKEKLINSIEDNENSLIYINYEKEKYLQYKINFEEYLFQYK